MSIATLAGWAKHLFSGPNPHNELEELHRAELRARTEIRAALSRLAAEFDVLPREVDEAMVQIDDVLGDITDEVERSLDDEIESDLDYEIEYQDEYYATGRHADSR